MDCSPPASSVHGILQARILEWVCHSLLQPVKVGGEQFTGFPETREIVCGCTISAVCPHPHGFPRLLSISTSRSQGGGGGMGWHVSPLQAADTLSARIRSRAPSYPQKGQKLVFEWSCDPDQISITMKGRNGLMRSASVSMETWPPMKIGLASLCISLSVALLFSRKPHSSHFLKSAH